MSSLTESALLKGRKDQLMQQLSKSECLFVLRVPLDLFLVGGGDC